MQHKMNRLYPEFKSRKKSDLHCLKMYFKNSKVFEQKDDLLNFKANIDPMAMLSQASLLSQAEPS